TQVPADQNEQNCFRVHLRKSAFIRALVAITDDLPDGRAYDTESNDKSKAIRYYAAPTFENSSRQLKMKNHQVASSRRRLLVIFAVTLSVLAGTAVMAQRFSPDLFKSLHWRNIGPFRGGRTRAVAGVPSQPNVFYIAQVNGGVWKTDDYGQTWTPIFDDQPTGSVGCIAVAPSDPNIVYVGSGEGLQRPDLSVGDVIYKSTDAGKTWTHLGLRDGQQIPQIAVDPRDANRIIVAVAGHPYA